MRKTRKLENMFPGQDDINQLPLELKEQECIKSAEKNVF
jgi:hypothetical protein